MDTQKFFNWTLKLFLFLSPIFFFKDYYPSYIKGMFFILGTFVLFGVSLSCIPKRKFSNIWLSIFLILAFVRIFFDDNFGNTTQERFNFWLGCAGFIYVLVGVLLFYVVYTHADNIRQYLAPIIWVSIFNTILAIFQLINYDFMWIRTPSICGLMETNSQLGQYSALSLPILTYFHPILSIIALISLLISKSISPIVASVIGMTIFCILAEIKKGLISWIAIIVSALIIMIVLNYNYILAKWQCRPIMWRKTAKIALQKPYLGWGYQSFNEKVLDKSLGQIGSREISRPHNDYLHTAQELGFPILIAIAMFFINLFRKFIAVKEKSRLLICLATSIIIVLVNMSGQSVIRYASIAGTFVVLLALFNTEVDSAC